LLLRRRPPRILVVDDQPSIAGLMSQLLTMRGYEVITAENADQAEAEVRRQAPDLILSDVMMPGKSGYEFCRGLKENPATRLIPFVLITGLTDSADKLRGIEAGADDFLNKPVLAEELIARVHSLLRLKEFTDELETADSVLCTLGLIVEGRDPYTEGHCERLAANATELGRHLGMDEDSILALRRGGYLHDLGKIAVPDEILNRRRKAFVVRTPIASILRGSTNLAVMSEPDPRAASTTTVASASPETSRLRRGKSRPRGSQPSGISDTAAPAASSASKSGACSGG